MADRQQQAVVATDSSHSNSTTDIILDESVARGLPEQHPSSALAPGSSSSSSSSDGQAQQQVQRKDSKGRWIRITVASIKAVLFLELAGMVAGQLVASRSGRRRSSSESDAGSDSDLDPADVLMDYLTGRTSLSALQLLRNEQLSAAVDNLVTEDFAELGVKDRGREIRFIVNDIIQAREQGVDTPSSRQQRRQSEGLGKVGPLRFRNSTKKALAREAAPAAGADAADAAATEGGKEQDGSSSNAAAGKQ